MADTTETPVMNWVNDELFVGKVVMARIAHLDDSWMWQGKGMPCVERVSSEFAAKKAARAWAEKQLNQD